MARRPRQEQIPGTERKVHRDIRAKAILADAIQREAEQNLLRTWRELEDARAMRERLLMMTVRVGTTVTTEHLRTLDDFEGRAHQAWLDAVQALAEAP